LKIKYFYHETLFSTKREKLYVVRSFKNYLTTIIKLPSFFFFFFFKTWSSLLFLTPIYEHVWIEFQLFKTKSLFLKYGVKHKIFRLASKCIYKDKMSKPVINLTRKKISRAKPVKIFCLKIILSNQMWLWD
jgi:hypothetical protein